VIAYEKASDSEPSAKKKGDVYIPAAPGAGGDVPDQVSQGDIMQTVLAHRLEIVACVKLQKAKESDLSGTLVMRWMILTSGKTTSVSAQTEEFKNTYLASCMSDLIRTWMFPRHKQPQDPISFPFKF
jgi:hypothetical protein